MFRRMKVQSMPGHGRNGDKDPSPNVLDLVEASGQRQDDLRLESYGRVQDSLRWMERLADLREKYADKLRQAETDRINAIRSVDVGAVGTAALTQETRATTLAAQVATTAEANRTQVAAAATAQTIALAAALEPVQKDIAELRKVQYETAGGKLQTADARDIASNRMLPVAIAIGVVGVVGMVLMQQLSAIRRAQFEAIGGRANAVEARNQRSALISSATAVLLVVAAFLSIIVVAAIATKGFTQ